MEKKILQWVLISLFLGGNLAFGWQRNLNLLIHDQWSGTDSHYSGNPTFFLIRTLDEMNSFWEKHHPGEEIFHVDFNKVMLFVWAPGKSLFDYCPTQVVRFFKEGNRFSLLLAFERKRTGGYWRNPYLIAILGKVEKGDIDIYRIGSKLLDEPERMPLCTIWDMGGERKVPCTVVTLKVPPKSKTPIPNQVESSPPSVDFQFSNNEVVSQPKAVAVKKNETAPQVSPSATKKTPPPKDSNKTPPKTVNPADGKTPDSASSAGNASDSADPFGDAFNLDF